MKIFPLRRLIRYRFFLPTSKYARNTIDNLNISFTRAIPYGREKRVKIILSAIIPLKERSVPVHRSTFSKNCTSVSSANVDGRKKPIRWTRLSFDKLVRVQLRSLFARKETSRSCSDSSATFSLYEFRFSFRRNDDRGALTPNGDAARKKRTVDVKTLSLIVVNPLTG